jgi:hypothetical protein
MLTRWILPLGITVLALADGVLHLTLDFVLFHGQLFGSGAGGGPPGGAAAGRATVAGASSASAPVASGTAAGAAPVGTSAAGPGGAGAPPGPPSMPFPLPLNELFLLNFLGFVVLVLWFWFGPRRWAWLARRRWLIDLVLLLYTAASVVGWFAVGRPNPMGLGYLSKALELALILALVVHARTLLPTTTFQAVRAGRALR